MAHMYMWVHVDGRYGMTLERPNPYLCIACLSKTNKLSFKFTKHGIHFQNFFFFLSVLSFPWFSLVLHNLSYTPLSDPWNRSKMNMSRNMTKATKCAPSEDSDQPGHPPSLVGAFAVRMKKAWVLSFPLSAQRRLIRLGRCPGWYESSLGAHSFCWFCHVTAHMSMCTKMLL